MIKTTLTVNILDNERMMSEITNKGHFLFLFESLSLSVVDRHATMKYVKANSIMKLMTSVFRHVLIINRPYSILQFVE